ncbi:MAG: hypothetical protein ACI358_03470 [Candidatus Limimorpha sp.]
MELNINTMGVQPTDEQDPSVDSRFINQSAERPCLMCMCELSSYA